MKITDVRIHKVANAGALIAIASVTFDECFVVHEIKLLQGDTGLFIAMPSFKKGNGEFKDIAHPIVASLRQEMTQIILDAYNEFESKEKESSES